MPEGPETKIITDGLKNKLLGRTITKAYILGGRYSKKEPEGWKLFSFPLKVTEVGCKGKFIFVSLEKDFHIFNTLGMTGGWSGTSRKHSRVLFCLDNGEEIYFNDIRNFGTLKLVNKKSSLKEKLDSIGPDMLSEDISLDLFTKRIKSSKKTVVEALMNQSIVSGVGNYLKSECLYFSRISPHRLVSGLTDIEISTLNNVIKSVIRESYRTGGATIYTFSGFNGQIGDYKRRFAVYNQLTDPEGREIKRETTRDDRTSFWVPEIQQ